MPIASRRTLLPRPTPSLLKKSVSLTILVGLLFGLMYCYPVALVPLGIFVVSGAFFGVQEKRRQARIAAQRPRHSICTFVRDFDCRRVDTRVLRAIHEELQGLTAIPLQADDRLTDTLHPDHEDFDLDIAPIIAVRTGRSLANTRINPYYNRVHTVADVVAFFCAQPFTKPAPR